MRRVSFTFMLIIMIVNITIGTWSSIEILSWFGKTIPMIWNIIIGFLLGQFTIPVAIIGHILRMLGII